MHRCSQRNEETSSLTTFNIDHYVSCVTPVVRVDICDPRVSLQRDLFRGDVRQDLVDAARASFSTNQPHLAVAELASWKETAAALAAGLGHVDLEWLDRAEAVERP